jgi:LacI family transcriptional regulator
MARKKTGRMIAEHFLDRGFKQFGIYDLEVETYFSQRQKAFVDAISEDRYPVSLLHSFGERERPTNWERNQE